MAAQESQGVPRGTSPVMHPLCNPREVFFAPMELSIACFFAGGALMVLISLAYTPGVIAIAPLILLQAGAVLAGQKEKQILNILAGKSQAYAIRAQARPGKRGKVKVFQP